MLSTVAMEKAMEQAKACVGGSAAMAKAIGGLTPQAVSQWKRAPAERVLDIERVTGISRHDLRPDIFGPAPSEIPNDAGDAPVEAGPASGEGTSSRPSSCAGPAAESEAA